MNLQDYLTDPCRASSLPYWKACSVTVPAHITVVRDDKFSAAEYPGTDERYFKLLHELKNVPEAVLPAGFALVSAGVNEFARHINACYEREGVSAEALLRCQVRRVYRPELWLSVADEASGNVVASAIAELDGSIGEGVLEWIQVSPAYRRRRLGAFLVCELLRRLQGRARFVTVSGRMDSESRPFALYKGCGFTNEVIWHVITKR